MRETYQQEYITHLSKEYKRILIIIEKYLSLTTEGQVTDNFRKELNVMLKLKQPPNNCQWFYNKINKLQDFFRQITINECGKYALLKETGTSIRTKKIKKILSWAEKNLTVTNLKNDVDGNFFLDEDPNETLQNRIAVFNKLKKIYKKQLIKKYLIPEFRKLQDNIIFLKLFLEEQKKLNVINPKKIQLKYKGRQCFEKVHAEELSITKLTIISKPKKINHEIFECNKIFMFCIYHTLHKKYLHILSRNVHPTELDEFKISIENPFSLSKSNFDFFGALLKVVDKKRVHLTWFNIMAKIKERPYHHFGELLTKGLKITYRDELVKEIWTCLYHEFTKKTDKVRLQLSDFNLLLHDYYNLEELHSLTESALNQIGDIESAIRSLQDNIQHNKELSFHYRKASYKCFFYHYKNYLKLYNKLLTQISINNTYIREIHSMIWYVASIKSYLEEQKKIIISCDKPYNYKHWTKFIIGLNKEAGIYLDAPGWLNYENKEKHCRAYKASTALFSFLPIRKAYAKYYQATKHLENAYDEILPFIDKLMQENEYPSIECFNQAQSCLERVKKTEKLRNPTDQSGALLNPIWAKYQKKFNELSYLSKLVEISLIHQSENNKIDLYLEKLRQLNKKTDRNTYRSELCSYTKELRRIKEIQNSQNEFQNLVSKLITEYFFLEKINDFSNLIIEKSETYGSFFISRDIKLRTDFFTNKRNEINDLLENTDIVKDERSGKILNEAYQFYNNLLQKYQVLKGKQPGSYAEVIDIEKSILSLDEKGREYSTKAQQKLNSKRNSMESLKNVATIVIQSIVDFFRWIFRIKTQSKLTQIFFSSLINCNMFSLPPIPNNINASLDGNGGERVIQLTA